MEETKILSEDQVKNIYHEIGQKVDQVISGDKELAMIFLENLKKSVNATTRRVKTLQKSFDWSGNGK
jgi:hypothetical protein